MRDNEIKGVILTPSTLNFFKSDEEDTHTESIEITFDFNDEDNDYVL